MASPSSFPPRSYNFNVFASFHGPDVRKTLLSHIREQFNRNGITMFDDQKIVRSATIEPSLKEAIEESRISIVILSKRYASSSWCLDELVDILECKKSMGQIVMTIFYGVDPSDVRKQTREFGKAFEETCARKTEEKKQKWSEALNEVGNIAGEDFFNWDNEANMIKKIARDVSDKLNSTPSRDFHDMVGLETHLREMMFLLDLDYDGVEMVAITGPAGIGKTTIAKALVNRVSKRFQLTCFVDNLSGTYLNGQDELRLKEQFLSNILNQGGIRIRHSGVIEERLCKQRVLIILDDVNHIKQLEALVNDITWFGPGSRIVVTTENKELLQQHGINKIYHVRFPSDEEALKILCQYAFRNGSMYHDGFEEYAKRITKLCSNLPLGLSIVGSSLRGKKEDEWKDVMNRLETVLDRKIEDVLRVGFESLDENEQMLFLHISIFFNYEDGDLVKTMFPDNYMDVKHGLKILESRCLIHIETCTYGERIVIHRLLQQVGKKAIDKQKPWNRQILIDTTDICDVLEDDKGSRKVRGISFDMAGIDELSVSKKAFKSLPNLLFLRVHKSKYDGNSTIIHIPEEMEFPNRLRLLRWEAYPSKSLPAKFNPEYLVELSMVYSKFEYLWQGTQPLMKLKKLDLSWSFNLKGLPDLSKATNLEKITIGACWSLVEIPSSFSHLHKLEKLEMSRCKNLEVIPADMNLASLDFVGMAGCSRLRNLPTMSTNVRLLYMMGTAVEELPPPLKLSSRLTDLNLRDSGNLKDLTHLPMSLRSLDVRNSDIERIPDCIKHLHHLTHLDISGCRRLTSLPELPCLLKAVRANDCESLETVFYPLKTPMASLEFINCFKLGEKARRDIIQQQSSGYWSAILPGRQVPEEFDQRVKGNSLELRSDDDRGDNTYPICTFVTVCVVISPTKQITKCTSSSTTLIYGDKIDGGLLAPSSIYIGHVSKYRQEHLLIFDSRFQEHRREIVFESSQAFVIVECGAKLKEILYVRFECGLDHVVKCGAKLQPLLSQSYVSGPDLAFEDESFEVGGYYEDETDIDGDPTDGEVYDSNKDTHCWSWLFLYVDLSNIVRKLGFGKKTIEAGTRESDDMAGLSPIHVS